LNQIHYLDAFVAPVRGYACDPTPQNIVTVEISAQDYLLTVPYGLSGCVYQISDMAQLLL
jgi:hypothetical protein